MNLLCPNCQKMLTVPEEFAGQLMKCPLCSGAFTVPGLAGAAPPLTHDAGQEPDVYSIRHEPAPPSPSPPPSYLPPSPSETTSVPPPSPKSAPRTEHYQSAVAVSLSPTVLPWIAPACLLLVFFLQFFNWVGLYPGGVPSVTQNAWQAVFGMYTEDGNLRSLSFQDDKYKPGWSVLTLFYLLLFFPALLITVASVAIDRLHLIQLPPAVENILPWRWGIVAAVNLIPFFFLALQLLSGFSLDSRYAEWVETQVKIDSKGPKSTPQQLAEDSARGKWLQDNRHTFWLRLVVLLHLTAIFSSALMFWIDQRGKHRPLPKLELKW